MLAILLFSTLGIANCTWEVSEYNSTCVYNDTVDLVVVGDFDTLGTAITLKSLILKSGSFSAGGLTASTITLEGGTVDVSELGTVLVIGDVTYSGDLKITDLIVEGSLSGEGELEAGKVIASVLGNPTTVVSKVDSRVGAVKIPYSADYVGIKFDGTNWITVDLTNDDDSYFVLAPVEGETLMLATVAKLTENPAVTLTSPLDITYNKSSVEFLYSVTNSSLLDRCELYVDGVLNATDTILGEFKFTHDVSDGDRVWKVNCTDMWGNSSVTEGNVKILNDVELPGVVFERNPATGYIYVEEEITVNCRASDNIELVGMKLYDYNDDFCANSNGEQCSKTLRWITSGERRVFCSATDHNGNNKIEEIVIEVRDHSVSNNNNNNDNNDNDNKDDDKKEEKKEEKASPTGLVLANSDNIFEFDVTEGVVTKVSVKCNKSEIVLDVNEVALGDNPEPEGKIYKFIEIETDADAIEEARIRFTVSKTWLEEQGIDKSGVVLLHYKNGTWVDLSTMVVEDGDEVVFESLCYDFSMFAVVGKQGIDFGFVVIVVGLGAIIVSGFMVITRGLKVGKKKYKPRAFGPPKGKPGYKFGKGFS